MAIQILLMFLLVQGDLESLVMEQNSITYKVDEEYQQILVKT